MQKKPVKHKKLPPKPGSNKKLQIINHPKGSLLIWGLHGVKSALLNPKRGFKAIYCTPQMQKWLDEIVKIRINKGSKMPPVHYLDKFTLSSALDHHVGNNEKNIHQGVVAVVEPLNAPSLEDWLENLQQKQSLVLLLDQVTDIRNIGAILRSAWAFGADAIITTDRNCPQESGAMIRAAAGAADHIPLIRVVNLTRAMSTLQKQGFILAGMTAAGKTPLKQIAGHERLGIIMGAEDKGLRRLTAEKADLLVRIPIANDMESLNVSVAAAIALYAANAS